MTEINEDMPELKTERAIGRFQNTGFKLEGELVGSTHRKVSKKGAVRLSILPQHSKTGENLAALTGLKGAELKAFHRERCDEFKSEACAFVSRIGSSKEFTGKSFSLNSKGDVVTVQFRKVEPISAPGQITIADALKKLGIDSETLKRAIAIAKEDEEFSKLEQAEEEEKIAKSAQGNGEVEKVEVKE